MLMRSSFLFNCKPLFLLSNDFNDDINSLCFWILVHVNVCCILSLILHHFLLIPSHEIFLILMSSLK